MRFLPTDPRLRELTVLAMVTLGILLVSANLKNHYTGYDSRGALLVSESVVRHGTLHLDTYEQDLVGLEYRFQERRGNLHYVFPLGTSLLSIPAVAVADAVGMEMIDGAHESRVQIALAAITVALAFLLIFVLARRDLSFEFSLAFAGVFVLGSSLVSTMGTALWSFNYTVVSTLGCVLLLRDPRLHQSRFLPSLLGLLLFVAFLCRPTSAIFIALVLAYLLVRDRRVFAVTSVTAAAGVLLLALWSWREFGQVLPDYYLPRRISEPNHFWTAVYGNLLSPSRGVLIHSPFLILIALMAIGVWREIARRRLFWLGILWFVIHLGTVSRFPHWWGGHSFGSRLLTDAMPALVLISIVVVQAVRKRWPESRLRAWTIGLLIAGAIAVFIHTGQGLYNSHTRAWNSMPNVDTYSQTLFDWRYPQFLATSARNARKLAHHHDRFGYSTIEDDRERATTDATGLRYEDGWLAEESWGRWAGAREVTFSTPIPRGRPVLVIRAASRTGLTVPLVVRVFAEGRMLRELEVVGPEWRWRDYRIVLPEDLGPGPVRFRLEMDHGGDDVLDSALSRWLPVQSIRFEPRGSVVESS
jgi:hypothetical protein